MTGHNLESFINTVLIKDLKRMVYDAELHYVGFGNVAVGIEFLGACVDGDPFEQQGLSKKRFAAGIDTYMSQIDSRYATYNDQLSPFYLYKYLRCGMAHIMRPQGTIGFCCRSDAQKAGYTHLDTVNGGNALLLTAEGFYDDFAKACALLLADLPTKTDAKFQADYLPVSELPPTPTSSGASPLSGV
jgi:hypothetical protein